MTPEGREELAKLMAPWVKGTIRITSDSGETASAPAEVAQDGSSLVVTAVFDERTANFKWAKREVIANTGTVLDTTEKDFGEKVLGHIWTVEVPVGVGAAA